MAVKFSQFTTGSSLADIDYFVGYKGTDNIQVAKSLLSGTTYTIDVPVGTSNSINLAGSDSVRMMLLHLHSGQNGYDSNQNVSANEINIAFEAALGDSYTLKAGSKNRK